MIGIFYAILASLGQGTGYTILKKSFKDFPSSIAFMFEMLFGLLIWIPFSIIAGIDTSNLGEVFFYSFLSAILSEAFVFYVLSKGEISITGTIFSTYPIFTILISRVVNSEILSPRIGIFILITIFGILILSFPEKFQMKELKKKIFIIYPLLGALAVGLSDSLSKNVLNRTTPATFIFCLAIMQIPVAIGFLLLEKRRFVNIKKIAINIGDYKYSIAGSFCLVVSMIFFWLAFESTLASIASPITGTYMVFILIFAKIFLKEKISRKDLIGILTTVIGVTGISIISN